MKSRLQPLATLLASLAVVAFFGSSVASAADNQSVAIDNFAFAPADITVSAGSTITWTNLQNAKHTTTSDGGVWDSSILTNGQSFSFTFDQIGDFLYHCDVHEEMTGVVHVVAAASAPVVEEVAQAPAAEIIEAAPAPAPIVEQAAPAPTPAPVTNSYGY